MGNHGKIAEEAYERWANSLKTVVNHNDSILHNEIAQQYQSLIDTETMYWLFSTAAQVVAAFTGLLVMCVVLHRQLLEQNSDKKEIKSVRVKMLLSIIFTIAAVTYDLYMLYNASAATFGILDACVAFICNCIPIGIVAYGIWESLE